MNRILVLLRITVVLVLSTSCTDVTILPEGSQLTASIENTTTQEGTPGSSRILFNNEPTYQRMNVVWKDGDSIGVFGSGGGTNTLYTTRSSAITDNGRTAIFTTTATKPTGTLTAYYPYQKNATMNGEELLLNMPRTQQYTTDGSGIVLPPAEAGFMVARQTDGNDNLLFSNVLALLQINLLQNRDSIVKKVIFTDLSHKPVSGPFRIKWTDNIPEAVFPAGNTPANDTLTLNCGEGISLATKDALKFYLLVPAREYPNGFQLDFILENGSKITKTIGTTAGKTLLKGKMYPVGDTYTQSVEVEYKLNDWVRVVSLEQYQQFSSFNYNSLTKTLTFTAPGGLGYSNSLYLILNFTNPLFPYGYAGQIDDITNLSNGRQQIKLIPITEITHLFQNLSIGTPLWNTDGSASAGEGLALDLASYITNITTHNGTRVPFSISGSTISMNVPVSSQRRVAATPSYLAPASISPFTAVNSSRIMAADKYTPTFTTPPMTYTFNDEQSLSAKVGVQVTMNTIMSMSIVDRTLEYLHFKATPVVTFTGEFTAQAEKTYEKEVPLLEFHFAPIPVGPIMIIPIMKLSAVADLKGKATITTTMEYKQEIPFGFSYVPGGFVYRNYLADKLPDDTSEPFRYTGKLQLQGSAAAGAKIYGGFKIFGLLEATANVDSRIRIRCNADFETALETRDSSNLLSGYFYEGFKSTKVETLLTPSIGVGVTSLGGVLNAKSQSEALEIPLSEHYLLPAFSNCSFKQSEKGKLEVSMDVKNKLLIGATLGIRIFRYSYWEVLDEIELGEYSGPPAGKDTWTLKKTVDITENLQTGFMYNVCAYIRINDRKILTNSLGKFLPDWQNSLTFTTSKSRGDSIQFYFSKINGFNTWIDLNNNKTMDSGEYVYFEGQKFAVNSQTITIYGVINAFSCNNQQITSFDLSNCPALGSLTCTNNSLTKLDLTANPGLTSVNVSNNNISSIVTANGNRLSYLNLSNNQLSTLTLTNQPELSDLTLDKNNLTDINVSNNPKLSKLTFLSNPVLNVNASNCVSLPHIDFVEGTLSQLNVSGCTGMSVLTLSENQLQTINLTGCKALTTLICDNNQLSTLNTADLKALATLHCNNNRLEQLNLSTNTFLKSVVCSFNQLTSVNAQNCNSLTSMDCSGNRLTTLNLYNCSSLYFLSLSNNQLFGSTTANMMNALPDRNGKSRGTLNFDGNSGYYEALTTATDKYWEVKGGTWTKDE